jgi:DHA1 family bicyclomycin/chloramphenicol resistance-like MFS transporter
MLPLGFTAFLGFGYILVLVGSSQAGMAADLDLDLARFGLLGATLALGVGTGVLVTGPLVDRLPRRPLILGATLLCVVSLGSVSSGMGFGRAILHVLALGAGGGCIDTLLNTVVIERYRERAARPLAVLHGAVTLGAVLSPPAIGWLTAATGQWTSAFRAGAVGFALLAIWIARVPWPTPSGEHGAGVDGAAPGRIGLAGWLPSVAGLGLVGFAYVGVENGVTVFAVPYATTARGLDPLAGQEAISTFWLGLLLARVGLALHRGPVGPGWLVAMGLAGAAAIGLGVATGWPDVRLWALGVGLCLGGVFPLMVTIAGLLVPHAVGTATALVMGTASLGGFAVPWLAGVLGDRAGAAVAMGSLAAASLAVAVGGFATRTRGGADGRVPLPVPEPGRVE